MGSPLKACLWLYLVRRVAGIAGMTCTSTTPLVWKIQQGQRFAYIAGIYNLPESKAPPLEGGSMAEALSCCDIAYFPTGCSLADKSNVVRLKEALQNLSTYAQAECRASANEFLSSVADLNSSTYRITLLTAFRRGMSSINPLWCTDAGTASMETFLRQRWGQRKPIFGLEDVSVECQAFQGNTVAEDQELATFMIDHFNEPWLSQMANSERNLQYRNNNLAWGVQKAMDANQDKNIFFAIPVTHLVDVAGRTGVLSQLTKAGLNPVRQTPAVAAAERCQASTYEAPGAAALDHCLKPPAQSQPLSCIQFEKQFEQILGKDDVRPSARIPVRRRDGRGSWIGEKKGGQDLQVYETTDRPWKPFADCTMSCNQVLKPL
eukprot:g12172.t1